VERCADALRSGRQPIALGYALGKAQEIVRILTRAGLPVTVHGSVAGVCDVYRELGVDLGAYRRYAASDFHGGRALDLMERGVLVAPPSVARSPFVTRFSKPFRVVLTGWALNKGAQFRYGVDAALPLSDHADFDELLELIEIVRPKKVLTHHGFAQFVDHLRKRGIDAALARPDPQLSLFD
jgi:DNA ligase-1